MKTIILFNKKAMMFAGLIISSTAILLLVNDNFLTKMKIYLHNNDILSTIIISALVILGFNVLIFLIGHFASNDTLKSSKTMHKQSRLNRKRRIESKQVAIFSGNK